MILLSKENLNREKHKYANSSYSKIEDSEEEKPRAKRQQKNKEDKK